MSKPKKAVYEKIGEEVKKTVKHHEAIIDEHGKIIKEAYDEEIEVIVPIKGVVYKKMTDEEVVELKKQQQEEPAPTLEERVDAMENAMLEMLLGDVM